MCGIGLGLFVNNSGLIINNTLVYGGNAALVPVLCLFGVLPVGARWSGTRARLMAARSAGRASVPTAAVAIGRRSARRVAAAVAVAIGGVAVSAWRATA